MLFLHQRQQELFIKSQRGWCWWQENHLVTSLPVGKDSAVSKARFEHSEMQTRCSRNHRVLWIFLWALWTQRAMYLIDTVPQLIIVTPQSAIKAANLRLLSSLQPPAWPQLQKRALRTWKVNLHHGNCKRSHELQISGPLCWYFFNRQKCSRLRSIPKDPPNFYSNDLSPVVLTNSNFVPHSYPEDIWQGPETFLIATTWDAGGELGATII